MKDRFCQTLKSFFLTDRTNTFAPLSFKNFLWFHNSLVPSDCAVYLWLWPQEGKQFSAYVWGNPPDGFCENNSYVKARKCLLVARYICIDWGTPTKSSNEGLLTPFFLLRLKFREEGHILNLKYTTFWETDQWLFESAFFLWFPTPIFFFYKWFYSISLKLRKHFIPPTSIKTRFSTYSFR